MAPHCPGRSPAVACLPRLKSILMRDAIAATMRYRERLLPVPDAAEQIRKIVELLCHHVNDVAFALYPTTTCEHAWLRG